MTPKQDRPQRIDSQTIEVPCPCGRIYITVSLRDGQVFEIFTRLGKQGGCASATTSGVAVTASLAIRSGTDPQDIARGLIGISCHRAPVYDGTIDEKNKVHSCVDAIGRVIRELSPPQLDTNNSE